MHILPYLETVQMRYIIYVMFSFSLKTKITGLLVFTVVAAIGVYLLFSIKTFESDKLAYVYDNLNFRGQISSEKLRSYFNESINEIEKLKNTRNIDLAAKYPNFIFLEYKFSPKKIRTFYNKNSLQKFSITKDFLKGVQLNTKTKKEESIVGHKFKPINQSDKLPLVFIEGKTANGIYYSAFVSSDRLYEIFDVNSIYGFYLFNHNRELLDSSELPGQEKQVIISEKLNEFSRKKVEQVVQEVSFNEKDQSIMTFAKLPEFDSYLVMEVNKKTALIAMYELLNKSLLFAIFLVSLGIIISILFSRTLTKPLFSILEAVNEIASGNYAVEIKVKSKDEIGFLARSFMEMGKAIIKRDKELADLNKNLEKLVEKRTMQLKEEAKKVENLINNMRQALFRIDSKGKVMAPVSAYSETIFGTDITDKNVKKTLYKDVDVKSEMMASIDSVMISTFGEDDLQWELSEDGLPDEVKLGNKILKVNYTPLWDDDELMHEIMIVVEDITKLKELEANEQEIKSEVEFIKTISKKRR